MQYNFLLICVIAFGLAGCQATKSQEPATVTAMSVVDLGNKGKTQIGYDIDLATYSPALDMDNQNKTQNAYDKDIKTCRDLATEIKAKYLAQQEKDKDKSLQRTMSELLSIALLGGPVKETDDYTTTTSADNSTVFITPKHTGGGVEYSKEIAEFGPAIVVDLCMEQNGWQLSAK